MGYWQKESKIEKKVGCFEVPLGSLGESNRAFTREISLLPREIDGKSP